MEDKGERSGACWQGSHERVGKVTNKTDIVKLAKICIKLVVLTTRGSQCFEILVKGADFKSNVYRAWLLLKWLEMEKRKLRYSRFSAPALLKAENSAT